jgi:hypothetical protein
VARIAVVCRDLLLGSRIQGGLTEAGHAVALVGGPEPLPDCDALVVDVSEPAFDGAALGGRGIPALGFYSHVEPEHRRRAEEAGFKLVVPRSRLARELPELVRKVLA